MSHNARSRTRSPAHFEHACLDPPQFRLSTLMLVISAFGVLLGLSLVLPPLMTFGMWLLAVAISSHVAGNFYGTRLRDKATELIRHREAVKAPPVMNPPPRLSHQRPAPTGMTERAPLGACLAPFALVAMAVSIAAGCYWLSTLRGAAPTIGDYIVSSIAFGMLGGMGGFLLGGFLCIGYRTLKQTSEQANVPDE